MQELDEWMIKSELKSTVVDVTQHGEQIEIGIDSPVLEDWLAKLTNCSSKVDMTRTLCSGKFV